VPSQSIRDMLRWRALSPNHFSRAEAEIKSPPRFLRVRGRGRRNAHRVRLRFLRQDSARLQSNLLRSHRPEYFGLRYFGVSVLSTLATCSYARRSIRPTRATPGAESQSACRSSARWLWLARACRSHRRTQRYCPCESLPRKDCLERGRGNFADKEGTARSALIYSALLSAISRRRGTAYAAVSSCADTCSTNGYNHVARAAAYRTTRTTRVIVVASLAIDLN
jgi:hypothetical protein